MIRVYVFISVCLLFIFSYFLEKQFLPYLEKSSYVWEVLKEKQPSKKNVDLLVLGDSQVLSGVNPKFFESTHLQNKASFSYFYNPRPSEQLESIYHFLLKHITTKKIQPKLVIWNVSPIHFTKNGLMESNKKLFIERETWSVYVIFDPTLRNFYLPKKVDILRYALINLFPTIKLSSQLNSEFSLIPRSLNLNLQSQKLEEYLSHNPLNSLQKNFQRNQKILFFMQENFGYIDWNLDENTQNKQCFQSSFRVPLEAKFAYSIPRTSAYETLKKIIHLLKEHNISFLILYIPFSPSSEELFQNHSSHSPFGKILLQWEIDFPNEKWMTPVLEENDYGDYVHPNFCGAKKITQNLIDIISQKEFLK